MSDEEVKTTAEATTTLLGGVDLVVRHLPAEALDPATLKRLERFQPLLGTEETLKVRQVMVPDRTRYCHALLLQDESTQLYVYVEKEPDWFETLTPQSLDAILNLGLEINLDFFGAWSKRQAKVRKQQQPDVIATLQTKLAEMEQSLAGLLSTNSASSSQPSTS